MNQKLSNKGLWVLFVILVIIAIQTFNYKPPCIPAYNTPSYTDSTGVIIVDTTACQPAIPGINDKLLMLAKQAGIMLSIAAICILVWIIRRMKLNKFYSKNTTPITQVRSGNRFVALIKYWTKPVLIGVVVIGLVILGMYVLYRMGLFPSGRY